MAKIQDTVLQIQQTQATSLQVQQIQVYRYSKEHMQDNLPPSINGQHTAP